MRSIHVAIPAILLATLSTILMFTHTKAWAFGLAIGIISLVILYFLKDAIDWKYYLKNPPVLEPPVKRILMDVPFYRQLHEFDKVKFEERLALFMLAHEYKIQPTRKSQQDEPIDAPEDIKAICSIPAIMLTLNEDDYLQREIEQIVLYNHPFPSPLFPQVHHCESNMEDKVIIYSMPHLNKGIKEPFTYFDVGMYEWVRVSGKGSRACVDWDQFNSRYGVPKESFELAIGLPQVDLPAICKVMEIHHSYLHTLQKNPNRIV